MCFSSDGWSNVRNQPIICSCVINEDGSVTLVDTTDTSGNQHTSDYLTELAVNAIIQTQNKFKCYVKSVVTDSAPNMAKMRRMLQEKEKDSGIDIIAYGCSAHLMNLLAKDLNVEAVTNQVLRIIKYFRNNHSAKAYLSAEGGTALVMPLEVRWSSSCNAMESYLKNWAMIMKICEEHRKSIDNDIYNLVCNISLKRNTEDLLNCLKPISEAIDMLQKDNCNIARCVLIWKQLLLKLEEIIDASRLKKVNERYEQAITPYHIIAFMLSPSCAVKSQRQNILLKPEEKETAIKKCEEEFPELLVLLLRFYSKLSPYNGPIMSESVITSMTDIEWWTSIFSLVDVNTAQKNAVTQLMTATASSAGIERIFSTFGLVHSDLRNRLGIEKAAKLTFLMKCLN